MSCFVPKILAVKVDVKLRNRRKKVVWGLGFVGGRDTRHFRRAFSNRSYFQPFGRIWFSSVQWASRIADEKEKKEELENVAILAMYCHLRPPDASAFGASIHSAKFHRPASMTHAGDVDYKNSTEHTQTVRPKRYIPSMPIGICG